MNANPVLHWTDHAGERQAMPLADVKREFEQFLQWRAQQAQPAASGEPVAHVPAGPEAEAATDAKLGLVLLPPIRVDRATHAALQELARARGLIVQAIVRERLAPYAVPDATAQPAPARVPLTDANTQVQP